MDLLKGFWDAFFRFAKDAPLPTVAAVALLLAGIWFLARGARGGANLVVGIALLAASLGIIWWRMPRAEKPALPDLMVEQRVGLQQTGLVNLGCAKAVEGRPISPGHHMVPPGTFAFYRMRQEVSQNVPPIYGRAVARALGRLAQSRHTVFHQPRYFERDVRRETHSLPSERRDYGTCHRYLPIRSL
jgi:hypothetical protein